MGAARDYRSHNPDISGAVLVTDGAACYSGTEFAAGLGWIGLLSGLFISVHIITESGCGKNRIDGHFSRVNAHLHKVVQQGRGKLNVTNARSASVALASLGGLNGSITLLMEFTRLSPPSSSKGMTAPKKFKAIQGLDRSAQRKYSYDNDDKPVDIELFRVPLFKDTPDSVVSAGDLARAYPEWLRDINYGDGKYTAYYADEALRAAHGRSRQVPMKVVITAEDRSNRAKRIACQELKLRGRHEELIDKQQAQVVDMEARSTCFHCPVPSCGYHVSSKAWFDKHLEDGQHQSADAGRTDQDNLVLLCHEALQGCQQVSTLDSVLSTQRVDRDSVPAAALPAITLCDGVTPLDLSALAWEAGWAHRRSSRPQPSSERVTEFLLYLQERSTVDGLTKTLPSDGARAMRLRGTAAGEAIFNASEKDRATMQRLPGDIHFFRMREWRDVGQIKAQISKPTGDLRRSLQVLQDRRQALEAREADPLVDVAAKITSKIALLSRLKALERGCTDQQRLLVQERIDNIRTRSTTTPLKDLRPLLVDIMRALEPEEQGDGAEGGAAESDTASEEVDPFYEEDIDLLQQYPVEFIVQDGEDSDAAADSDSEYGS